MSDTFRAFTSVMAGQTLVGSKTMMTLFRPAAARRVDIYRIWVSPQSLVTTVLATSVFQIRFISAENAVPGGVLLASQQLDNIHSPSTVILRQAPNPPAEFGSMVCRSIDPPAGVPQEKDLFRLSAVGYTSPITLRDTVDQGIAVIHVVSGVVAVATNVAIGMEWTEE